MPDGHYSSLRPVLTHADSLSFLIGTASRPSGFFYRQARGDARDKADLLVKVSAKDLTHVQKIYEKEIARLGASDPTLRSQFEATFCEAAEYSAFPFSLIEPCIGLDPDAAGDIFANGVLLFGKPRMPVIGVDVARTNDKTVVAYLRGNRCERLEVLPSDGDLMQTAGRIVICAHAFNARRVAIDSIGLGAGVTARVDETLSAEPDGAEVVYFVANERADDSEHFANRKSEIASKLRKMFEDRAFGIPADEDLIRDLLGVTLRITSNGRTKVEDPPGQSPDHFDALIIGIAPSVTTDDLLPLSRWPDRSLRWMI